MTKHTESGWFYHTVSGQTFEAEGEQAALSRKDRDVEELAGPPENSAEAAPDLAKMRERLTALGIPWSENAALEELQSLLDTETTAWCTALKNAGVKVATNARPETLKAKVDGLK